ncbi:ATP-binding cassette transporter snq2 [Pichia californica]|uniref:ATP-binding cassette transporter snq2 n=1 Tax=Pichia californica TaxID=460514 RepID=A0A9P6WM46_9ASCO|nr:ATP-binding cassette transporter snq2 [[Candida] californica]
MDGSSTQVSAQNSRNSIDEKLENQNNNNSTPSTQNEKYDNDIDNDDDDEISSITNDDNISPPRPGTTEYYDGLNQSITRSLTRSLTSNDPNQNVMTRLSTLSKEMSHMTAQDMETFQLNPQDFNLKKILQYVVNFNNANSAAKPKIEVIFKNLNVIGKNTSASVLKDISYLFYPFIYIIDKFSKEKENTFDFSKLAKKRKVIKDVSGFALPGTMTLALGRPGAGCSTLLKILSGEKKSYIKTTGTLSYSGLESEKMFKFFKNILIYNPELDVHFPYLTVEETLKFAIACKTPNIRVDNETRETYIENMKDLFEILFGLKHVEKTIVGNDFVRGISGGERKRVSISEAMVTDGTVYCFDNATRGLDASTALEFTESLRTFTNVNQITSIVTIYQASEKIYQLFDYVTVLYLGRQVYYGKINDAVKYFEEMGFIKEQRQTSCEFLTCVTDPVARKSKPGITNLPKTADDFEKYWQNSHDFEILMSQIDDKLKIYNGQDTFDNLQTSKDKLKEKHTSKHSFYQLNYLSQLKLCCLRRYYCLLHNKVYTITFISASVIQSLIIGSLGYNTPTSTLGAFSRGGLIFFACLYFSIMTLAETPTLFQDKPILNKQYAYTMYHPSAELIAKQLVNLPIRTTAIVLFSIIMYFLSNLKREPGPFFQFMLITLMIVQAVGELFTLFSSFMPNLSSAMAINGVILLGIAVYSSYMIQLPNMYWWFKWFAYTNPVLYAFEAMMTMQFHHLRMECFISNLIPYGPSYTNIDTTKNQVCGFVGAAASKILYNGSNDVNGDIYLLESFTYAFSHCWRNFGFLFIFIAGYLIINAIAVEIYNPIPPSSDKLLFIKNASVSQALINHFKQIAPADEEIHKHHTESEFDINASTSSDDALNDDIEKNAGPIGDDSNEIDQSQTAKSAFNQLGSPDTFCWEKVDYVVPYDGSEKKLLDSIQGYVLPGTMTALIGESGAGKTTLLNVLSRRTEVGVITGDMLVNGKPVDLSFERRTGYVQQQDLHISELTVKESLLFSARLRRPQSVPDEEKIEYVETIMKILHMEDYADSIAGVPGYGLNVEQRKKLSIATELVAKPSLLLFLDEPTSGLDSQSSWAIVQVLKELADAGQAILCTIHQPSAVLFEQFDRLLLLKRGGQTVYFGDIGKNSRTMLNYFESRGARKCEDDENPAEYMLEVIGAGATSGVAKDWHETWLSSDERKIVSDKIQQIIEDGKHIESKVDPELQKTFATPYFYQFYQVNKRTSLQLYRSIPYVLPKIFLSVVGGLVVGFSFWNANHTIVGMQDVMFAIFLTLVITAPIMNQIQTYAIQSRELFEVRESKSNTFHWSCLLISQYINEIPYCMICSTLFFITWYFPVQFDNEPSRCGFWWFTYCFFYSLYYPALALAILYPSPDLPSANVIMGLIFSFTMAFCGVFQVPALMPGFWKFMWRISPLTYFVGNLFSTLLHNRRVRCAVEEYNYLDPPDGYTCGEYLNPYFEYNSGYVNNPNDTSNCAVCKYSVGDQYLAVLEIKYSQRWRNIGFFCVYIGFNMFAMVSLYYIFRVRRMNPLTTVLEFFKKLGNKKSQK